MANNWTLFQEKMPPKGAKFIAVFSDGSGANMFLRLDNDQYIDCEGNEFSEQVLDDYLFWCEAPNIKFWFEHK